MDLDPRRLLILRAVGLRGGVSDAAQLLHLTPSAVSQQIALLEREVGVDLLDRSQRPAGLTAAGRLLAARAERIHVELTEGRRELTALSGRLSGPVVIASFSTVIRHLVVPAIRTLARTHPDLQPHVIELEGPPTLKELRSGGVDLVIVEHDGELEEPSYKGLAARPLAEDGYRVVVPSTWPPASHSMKDLANRRWITGPPETPIAQALERLAVKHAFIPERAHICVEYPTVLSLVAAGLGAAIVPMLALGGEFADQVHVTAIPHVGSRRLSALYRTSAKGPEPLVPAFIAALDEAVQAHGLIVAGGVARGR